MTKTELVAKMAATLGLSKKQTLDAINTFVDTVIAEVKGGKEVRLQGFGTFKSTHRKARTGVNPQKPEQKVKIPAMYTPSFKAGSEFKKAVKARKA